MKIDEKILVELSRYNKINEYILEQDATLPPPPEGELPPAPEGALPPSPEGALPPAPEGALPPPSPPMGDSQPVDIENDPDVEKLGDEDVNKKELEIIELN